MAGQAIPVKVGDIELLVETTQAKVPAAAPDPASPGLAPRVSAPVTRVEDAFSRAEGAIVAIASSVVGTVGHLAERAARPDELSVCFGLSFSATGDVVVAGATGQATLQVTLVYGSREHPLPGSQPPAHVR